MSSEKREYSFGSRLVVLFEIDQVPGIEWGSEFAEDGTPVRHGYLAHVVGTDEPAAVDFSAEELSRGTRLSPSLQVGCDVGERIWMPIEVREPTVEDESEFKVVVVGTARSTPNTMLADELGRGERIAA